MKDVNIMVETPTKQKVIEITECRVCYIIFHFLSRDLTLKLVKSKKMI